MKLIDVTIPIRDAMTVYRGNPAVRIRPVMTLEKDGVHVSELRLGSHTGTHVDAPSHFIKGGKGIDRVDAERFIGPAWVADLRRVKGGIGAGDLATARIPRASRRVLLRTSNSRWWHPARAFQTDFVYLAPDGGTGWSNAARSWLASTTCRSKVMASRTHPRTRDCWARVSPFLKDSTSSTYALAAGRWRPSRCGSRMVMRA